MNHLQLKKRIMRRVYMLYVLGKVLSKLAFKIYAGLALLYGIKVFVHVEAVANNMPDFNNLSGLYTFMTNAALNTDLAVQFIVFGVVALIAWVLRDAIKNIFENMLKHDSIQSTH
ncbi:hypothetical protein HON59_01430 [bacterium]|nr:hypothetical protein [bacterium]MBT4894711.1 hypothetical protein [bacterium]